MRLPATSRSRAGGTYFPLKGGYDPAYRACSPGKLIIHATLERAFRIGLERYEFLGSDDPYKQRWATAAYDRLRPQAFAPTLPGQLARFTYVRGRPVAARIVTAIQPSSASRRTG